MAFLCRLLTTGKKMFAKVELNRNVKAKKEEENFEKRKFEFLLFFSHFTS